MDITPHLSKERNIVKSYSSDGFEVSGRFFSSSLFLSVNKIHEVKFLSSELFFAEKLLEIFSKFSLEEFEVLLIGTGNRYQRIPQNLKKEIKEKFPNLMVDEMSSGAACRTFNVLVSEDRNVATLLICDGLSKL